jgi:hypothetical protein
LGRAVSLQFSILKVLAGQPGGRATVGDLNRTITLLSCPEWSARMKRLSVRVPDLDIFSSRYVLRDEAGWQLTEAGQAFLVSLEMPASIEMPAPAPCDHEIVPLEVIVTVQAPTRQAAAPALRLVVDNSRARRRTRRKDRANKYKVAF